MPKHSSKAESPTTSILDYGDSSFRFQQGFQFSEILHSIGYMVSYITHED